MAKTITLSSSPMFHAPGCFAFVKRGNGDKKWQREAYAGLGLCPEVVKEIMNGNACCEVFENDDTVQRITVNEAAYAAQLVYQPEEAVK